MEYKASIKSEEVFTVTINGVEFKGMRRVSEWEGFTKLEDAEGLVMILSDDLGPVTRTFDNIFKTQGDSPSWSVIKASPALVARMFTKTVA